MKALNKLMIEAKKVNAPLEMAVNPKKSSYRQSYLGQTFSPRKEFIDTRSGRKVSLAQARQIVAKFNKLSGF